MKRIPFIAVGLVVFTDMVAGAASPEEVVSQIRTGLAKLSTAEGDGKVYECVQKSNHNGENTTKRMVTKRQGDSVLFTLGKISVCMSDRLMFAVEKGGRDDEWVLRQADRIHAAETFRQILGQRTFAAYPLTASGPKESLVEVLDAPSFRATSSLVRPDGTIDVGFATEMNMNTNAPLFRTGVMTVSPKHDYAVIKWEQTITNTTAGFPIKYTYTRELIGTSGSVQCKSIQSTILNGATGQELGRETFEFLATTNLHIDPSEFTLDHYKIPIPSEAPEDRPGSRWPWWAIAGGACLVISLGFGWLARRRAARRNEEG